MPIEHEPQLNNLCIVQVKEESAYGADAAPQNDLVALLVSDGAEAEIDGDVITRSVVQSTFTPRGSLVGAKKMPLKIGIEAHGGGLNAGVLKDPDYGPLLRACGMQKTEVVRLATEEITGTFVEGEAVTAAPGAATGIFHCQDENVVVLREVTGVFTAADTLTGGTSAATADVAAAPVKGIEYRPITSRISTQKSALVYLYRDHILYLVKGCRGTFELSGDAGKAPLFSFNFTGLWTRPSDVENLPTVYPVDIVPPNFERAGAKLGAYDPILKTFKLTVGGTIQQRDDANSPEGVAGHYIGGREPALSIDPEMDVLANYDPFTLWADAAKISAGFTVGQTPGNRWRLHVPAFQHSKLSAASRGTQRTHQIDGTCTGSGDDDFRLTFM